MDIGTLILRLVLGGYLFGHGAQKLFGWFGGGGMTGTQTMVERLRFRPRPFWAWTVALGETLGGLLAALGFLSPLGSYSIIAAMLVATFAVHWSKGVWATRGGVELPATNIAAAAAIALTGPGRYSLDNLFGVALPEPVIATVGAIAVALGVAAAFGSRRVQAPQPTRPEEAPRT